MSALTLRQKLDGVLTNNIVAALMAVWLVTLAVSYTSSADRWLTVRAVQISNAHVGEDIPVVVDRDVLRSFRGAWRITVYEWVNGQWLVSCAASGSRSYEAATKFPADMTLSRWTEGACVSLPRGRYKAVVQWDLDIMAILPTKSLVVTSNIFEIG